MIARILLRILKHFKRKQLWLISDRARKASDNGEAFFRYMCKEHPEISTCFVIAKDCTDYKRIKKIGPVLARDSFIQKLFLLLSDYNCSSHGEIDVYNPFAGYSEPYRDFLSKRRFVFLQHGITYNDLSGWMGRYKKNMYGVVATAKAEYASLCTEKYGYTSKQIWLTGFPRFDRLYNSEENIITIMPTWRRYLFGESSRETKVFQTIPQFGTSEYVTFYDSLLNNEKLLNAASRLGYKIAFFPHPNILDHIEAFHKDERVIFMTKEMQYRDVYAKSNLVVTDYSSAVFDFSYLRKPVIYSQFDRDTFYSGQHTVEKGYFDHRSDGFGEVEYTLEGTVDRIIEYMENGCALKDQYRQRIDQFFAFNDKNNCQRVYEKIMELDENEKNV